MTTQESAATVLEKLAAMVMPCSCSHHWEPMPPNDAMPAAKCCPCWSNVGTGTVPRFPLARVECGWAYAHNPEHQLKHDPMKWEEDCYKCQHLNVCNVPLPQFNTDWSTATLDEVRLEDILDALLSLKSLEFVFWAESAVNARKTSKPAALDALLQAVEA